MEIPEPVDFYEVRVIIREAEIRIVFQKKVGNVVEMNEAVERGRREPGFLAQFITEETGGLVQIVNEQGGLRGVFGRVMVDNYPV